MQFAFFCHSVQFITITALYTQSHNNCFKIKTLIKLFLFFLFVNILLLLLSLENGSSVQLTNSNDHSDQYRKQNDIGLSTTVKKSCFVCVCCKTNFRIKIKHSKIISTKYVWTAQMLIAWLLVRFTVDRSQII